MTSTWTQNADGSVDFNGTVRFPAGTNLASGVGIVIFGPDGGIANFEGIAKGDPGVSPTMTFQTVQVAAGTTLPSPNPAVVFTPASGDTPPNYAVTMYVNAGATGAAGGTEILTATDLEGTAAAGYLIGYSAADSKAKWLPIPVGGWYLAESIAATASNTNALKNMSSIAIGAQPFDWWPEVFAQAQVIGATDTRVDLVARINSTTGDICGYGYGAAGAAPPPVIALPSGLVAGSDNIIPAGEAATIFLNAENQTDSDNPWNTTTSASFQVKVNPVPA
ncbi:MULTISPECIES: hypothetical protein [unclassified Mycobacterium]|uniref:hypothetical protein n=1 Tax=unclassified Mycobacterium TaxID=2642494 RepID=UPI0007FE891D|nr:MULTISPECIES: hypothetical protein [unclassified Mycobacterium]OBG71324.1 hypothetical protein A5700_12180 [Mycobacterium sp. E1214]OBH28692.1 hypothetical protein A5693_21495 [Mycobacterium sp. E1319]